MKIRTLILLGLPALLMGGSMVGCASSSNGALASAGSSSSVSDGRKAVKEAALASQAMTKHQDMEAVRHAEAAVAMAPTDATYRSLLGQAYLGAGRFQSAAQSFSDVLTLDPANGRAALNLALAQTALGQWDVARQTLADHADQITPADRGLALALAGDPTTAVQLLSVAARAPTATPTIRQNFALSLALAGHWQEARAVAAVDVSPDELDQRIAEWASFAKPKSASDQVAALLGVVPVADQGLPVQLALNASQPTQLAASAPVEALDTYMPGPATDGDYGASLADTASSVAAYDSGSVAMPVGAGPATIVFAPQQAIVQPIPVRSVSETPAKPVMGSKPVAPKAVASKLAVMPVGQGFAPSKGGFYVQLGAYENSEVARDAWKRIAGRTPHLASMTPLGMAASVKGSDYYRLSVGGFARGDANKLCASVRAQGGKCFVRTDAGDKTASWVKGGATAGSR